MVVERGNRGKPYEREEAESSSGQYGREVFCKAKRERKEVLVLESAYNDVCRKDMA